VRRLLWAMLVVILAGCTAPGGQPATPAPGDNRTYTHPGGVFSLILPPSWIVGDLSSGETLLMTFAPPEATRPPLTVYAVRLESPLDGTAFGAAMGSYLRSPHNWTLDVVDQQAMGDGSWRVTGVRQVRGQALPVNVFMLREGPFFSALEVIVPPNDPFQVSLLSLMVNAYRLNPAAVWPVGVVGDFPPLDENLLVAGGNLSFGALASWTDAGGGLHISGQVANRAPYPVEAVTVAAALLDAAGGVLAEGSAALPLYALPDGELGPFDVRFPEGRPRGVARYRLEARAQQAGQTGALLDAGTFDWEDRAEYDETGQLHIRGTVWHVGDAPAYDPQAVITLFDSADRVIGVAAASIGDGPLPPGGSLRFDVPLPPGGAEPVRYQVTIQAHRQP